MLAGCTNQAEWRQSATKSNKEARGWTPYKERGLPRLSRLSAIPPLQSRLRHQQRMCSVSPHLSRPDFSPFTRTRPFGVRTILQHLAPFGSGRPVDPFGSRHFTTFHRTLPSSHVTVQNQPSRVGAMRFLQPDLHATPTLPLRPPDFPRGPVSLQNRDLLSSQYDNDRSTHYGMAHLRSRYPYPHSAVPCCHCLRQGVAS